MIYTGDALSVLLALDAESVQCCVTSPPYWGLRDYGVAGQLGLEKTPEEYVEKVVAIFREVRRVLRGDGTLWLNLGDSYWSNTLSRKDKVESMWGNRPASDLSNGRDTIPQNNQRGGMQQPAGIKPKDLMGIPWRVAFALQADGWYLRSDIIWSKPNPMPESVTDRPTKAHEYVFLLSKSQRYFFDQEAVKEPSVYQPGSRKDQKKGEFNSKYAGDVARVGDESFRAIRSTRNLRSVWTVTTKPFKEAHFATFPPEIPERCIKAGSKIGDTVLDPFSGAGTTGVVAQKLFRKFIGIELNPDYVKMSERRIKKECGGLFND